MSQPEFHRAYDAMPEEYRAELIGGIVFEPSPLGYPHGKFDTRLSYLLEHYAAQTPGLQAVQGVTVILGPKDEVQPDVVLRIAPKYGGQSQNTRKREGRFYIKGAPEVVAEIAHSSAAIDLHLKKERYAVGGVKEYIVVCLKPARVHWFDLDCQTELKTVKGVFKSRVFPGLWIDRVGLLELDYKRSMAALNEGMASREYIEFVEALEHARP